MHTDKGFTMLSLKHLLKILIKINSRKLHRNLYCDFGGEVHYGKRILKSSI